MKKNAYSLIEVLIAGAILLVGIAAAAILSNALYTQEATDIRITQALNMQEQAARLWQLGLEKSTITNILPVKCSSLASPPSDSIHLVFNETTNTTLSGIPVDILSPLQIVFVTGVDPVGSPVYRTNSAGTVVRPTNR